MVASVPVGKLFSNLKRRVTFDTMKELKSQIKMKNMEQNDIKILSEITLEQDSSKIYNEMVD
jgi:hypothetical protein